MNAIIRIMLVVLVSVLAVSGVKPVGLLPAASAEPGPVAPIPPVAPVASVAPVATAPIAWTQLGRSDRIDILGSDQFTETDIPVPPGVILGQLLGTIGSVVSVIDGRVDVIDGRGLVLGSIPVQPNVSFAPFAVDLAPALVVNGVAKIRLVLRDATPAGNSCTRQPSLTLSQLSTTFLGQSPYPAVIADYLPGYTDQIVIRTGPTPTPAQQQAALELVAQLTRLYRPMPVRITVDTSVGPAQAGPPTRRVIELREEIPAGMTVTNPGSPDAALLITGLGVELSRQAALFSDRRVTLAQSSSAVVAATNDDVPRATTIKTFAQLGMDGQTSVLGLGTLYVGLDTGQFALGPVQEATLHLIGHYSPVVAGEASVVVRAGGTVLAARRLDESGLLDITGTIPAESIQSSIGIALELRYLPKQECAPLNDRMQFGLDPSSTIAVTPGSHHRGGFPVLPMAFTPDFDVVLHEPGHLRFAAEAVNLLAQQTGVALKPRIIDFTATAGAGSGLLFVGPGTEMVKAGFRPPVAFDGGNTDSGNTVDITGSPKTVVDLNGPIGVIQAFSNNSRMVLAVNGTENWSLVQRSFDYIRALDSRWASLSGDVVATGAAGQTVNLTLHEGGAMLNEYPGDSWKWWARVSVILVVIALIGVTAVLLWRRKTHQG